MAQTSLAKIPVIIPHLGVEEEQAVIEVIRSGWLMQGPRVEQFERCFAEAVGSQEAVAVSSCTTGLHLALLAAGVGAGDEVICPSLSYIATANSIVYAGATPVFADIVPGTFNIDPREVERVITPRTRAILAVHQIGRPAEMDELLAVAARHGLPVVEDAACAIGSEYKGVPIGRPHGKLACFSFHPRKILTTGDGGMITTDDRDVAARLRRLRAHSVSVSGLARHTSGAIMEEVYDEVGFNYRLTDLQAAIGIVQMGRLPGIIERRRAVAAQYHERLGALAWLSCPVEDGDYRHNYQSYMVELREDAPVSRDELIEHLAEQGISARRGVMAIHRQAPYRSKRWDGQLSATEAATDCTVILPLFDKMTEEQVDRVVQTVQDASGRTVGA